jgi:acetyl-CoA carboxylase biotin carboxyl carrier protein
LDKKYIEELIEIMDRSNLAEIEIGDGNTKIVLRKNTPLLAPTFPQVYGVQPQLQSQVVHEEVPAKAAPIENFHLIKSPMVGTFYASSSQGGEPFVRIGTRVEKDTAICILEAMKVMNEIQSDVSGIVHEILVMDGQPVEFGQPLFKIEIC